MDLSRTDTALIVSLTPYFLEKGNFWIEQNIDKILQARKTQSFFQSNTIFLKQGQKYNLSELLRKLDEMGYEKVLQVSSLGEFSHRGGIVDIFPINKKHALRIDFLGNEIEKIESLETEIKDEKQAKEILKKRLRSQKIFSDLKGLRSGNYLVHLDHGIGKFLKTDEISGTSFYVLEYAQGDKLYVPFGLERKLSKYIGFVEPKISRLGSQTWQKTKKKVREEAEKMAKDLLEIYAKREIASRPAYSKENEIDFQLMSTFRYRETPDQMQAIEEIKKDLELKNPMDRIVCGDVGFGKTEVALRTMIKAVKSGYQAAMLCPTTILASQHHQSFEQRLKSLPIKVDILSRLQSGKQQKDTIESLKLGKTDIVIGTHRLLSKDIEFKNLGLLVIDDEQRFGVRQKEKLKKMRASLDVLSLSATPIPRTLYMALSSLKNISLIQTPPEGRLPVKTFILPFSEKAIKEGVSKEIKKGGQVYYLHNRVETIEAAKNFLEKILPKTLKAKIDIAHGKMNEKKLVKAMQDFQNKKTDILIATTIIENGLDLPNVNTLIVSDATRLGLAQAYQIRGRVGRSHVQSFAYFFYGGNLSEKAKKRLKALKKAKELGAGYQIALRDLEIRGAGNILGKEQSGSINQVGLNLYCQILSEKIEKMKSK